jgi:hypothetical protein
MLGWFLQYREKGDCEELLTFGRPGGRGLEVAVRIPLAVDHEREVGNILSISSVAIQPTASRRQRSADSCTAAQTHPQSFGTPDTSGGAQFLLQ